MKNNFLDNLDGSWEDAISNTYEEANAYHIIDTKANINIRLDTNPIKQYKLGPNYYEDYISVDNTREVRLGLSIHSIIPKSIYFTIKIESIPFEKGCYLTGTTISNTKDNFNILKPKNKDLSIDYNFLDNFLEKAETALNLTDNPDFIELRDIIKNNIRNIKNEK